MDRVILDTDILSEFLKGHDVNVARHARAYAGAHTLFTFTSITVYEIMLGLLAKGADSQAQKALAWMRLNEQLIPIADDYLKAAEVKATCRKQGRIVELPDSLIASIAARLGLPLVTGNTGDFTAIQSSGLKITLLNWREE